MRNKNGGCTLELKDVGEFGLIRMIAREPQGKDVVVGIGDDAAVIKMGDLFQLFTTDLLVEGDHFRIDWSTPEQIGKKAMISNVSDIAAMGGDPKYALVSLSLNSRIDADFVKGIYEGMNNMARKFGVDIIGGDTTHGKLMVINIALVGETDSDRLILRSGARPGDHIMVTGPLGGSRAGLELLLKGHEEPVSQIVKHLEPGCRMDISNSISRFANSMIDVSDGLASEVVHICEESGVGAIVEKDLIPLHEDTVMAGDVLNKDPYAFALGGGEDFELVFTVPGDKLEQARKYGIEVGRIVEKEHGIFLRDPGRDKELIPLRGGYDHFRE